MPKLNTHLKSTCPTQKTSLHPLRRQLLESRLDQIKYQERQQACRGSFMTCLYGKTDYTQEKNDIMRQLGLSQQTNAGINPRAPQAIKEEITRFKQQYPDEYRTFMQQIQDDKKTWKQIDQEISNGKITPRGLSEQQWQNILDISAEELKNAKKEGISYCNFYARNRLLNEGIYMPPEQNANQIKDYVDNNPQVWEKIPRKKDDENRPTKHLNHQAAYKAAANGDTVIVVYKNPDLADHGHIALVDGQKEMRLSEKWHNIKLPTIDGYNSSHKKIETESLSWQFTQDREPDMDYYRYIGKKKEQE